MSITISNQFIKFIHLNSSCCCPDVIYPITSSIIVIIVYGIPNVTLNIDS